MKDSSVALTSVIKHVAPLIKFNHFSGICAFTISNKTQGPPKIEFTIKSFHFYRVLVTLFTLSLYAVYIAFQIINTALFSEKTDKLKISVHLSCWLYGMFVPILLLTLSIWKRQQLFDFFAQLNEYVEILDGTTKPGQVKRFAMKLYVFYGTYSVLSAISIGIQFWHNPMTESSLLYYLPREFVQDYECRSIFTFFSKIEL